MFFHFLLIFGISYSIRSKDAEKLFTDAPHKPVFVTLFSQWCAHCYEFKPTKEQIQNFYKGSKDVDIADINCDQERELCAKFEGSGTPRLYFVSSTIEKAERYEGSRTFEEIKAFIQKFIQPPVLQINSSSQFRSEISQNQNSSIFILQDLGNTEYSHIISKLADKYLSYPAQFVNLTYKKYPEADVHFSMLYPQTKTQFLFRPKKKFNERELTKFIEEHLYPPYGISSSLFFTVQKQLKEPFLVLEDWKHTIDAKIRDMTSKFPENLKTIEINCNSYEKFCRALKLNPAYTPSLTMVNTHRNTYFHYKGKMVASEIVPWVERVWNGKEKEEGPGAGILGTYRRIIQPFFNEHPWFLKTVGVVLILALVVFLVKQIKQLLIIKEEKYD